MRVTFLPDPSMLMVILLHPIFTWSIHLKTSSIWKCIDLWRSPFWGHGTFARYLRRIGQCAKTGCLPTLHPALLWTVPHPWGFRVPVIHHHVGETELPQVQPACLLHDFHSMATGFSCRHCEEVIGFQIVNYLHDTECLNHISMCLLLYKRLGMFKALRRSP